MSVEKQARWALRRVIFYRILGDVFSLPQFILKAFVMLLGGISRWFNRMEITIFCLEQDAARRYSLLTGLDLGTATGEPGRYAPALNPATQEMIQDSFMRDAMGGMGEGEQDVA